MSHVELNQLSNSVQTIRTLDGQNRAVVIAETPARVIVAIRIASVRWRSYGAPEKIKAPEISGFF